MTQNEQMVSGLLSRGYADKRVAEAMLALDRKEFIPGKYRSEAYFDHPVPIGFGQTISAPGVVAFMSRNLDVKPGMKVLEIGAGSAWQAAILGKLAGAKGKVWTVERKTELVEIAGENLKRAKAKNVFVVLGDGTNGYPGQAPYDRIVVTAAGPKLPPPLLEQLAEGGKLIMPVGGPFFQELLLVEKRNGEVGSKPIMSVVFVPLIGEHGHPE